MILKLTKAITVARREEKIQIKKKFRSQFFVLKEALVQAKVNTLQQMCFLEY